MIKIYKKNQAFTLIELLVVIGIIMILAAVGMMSYSNAQKVGRDAKRKADLKQVQSALEMYRADKGMYPTPAAGSISNLSLDLATAPNLYISSLPADPQPTNYAYYYADTGSGVGYSLCAYLENGRQATDLNCPVAVAPCGSGIMCNFGMSNP